MTDADAAPPTVGPADGAGDGGTGHGDAHAPAATGRRFGATSHADSAGQPWAGRSFQPNPNAGDDGRADAPLLAALTAFRAGEQPMTAVVDAVRAARLLVPLLAEAGETGVTPDGHLVDKTQELSLVTVAGPDGRGVLPAFTSVETMREWDPAARPIPIEGQRVAFAAAQEGQLVVLDPGSATEFALRGPALRAIAAGEPWAMPWNDYALLKDLSQAMQADARIASVDVGPGDPDARLAGSEVVVVLHLPPGLPREELEELVKRVRLAWYRSEAVQSRIDSLAIRFAA